jgi:hypothetical protein
MNGSWSGSSEAPVPGAVKAGQDVGKVRTEFGLVSAIVWYRGDTELVSSEDFTP